ncbi:hypothetical protein BP5796_07857 [Coleophoma crateriformis]|uniref:RCC1-like domain-containing protein n=1 Tax=Coleophoma crateriformis TaxID=565419 RepID=A0A3D8RCP1_9HELO|nr:hypothetical protein BP5796_07857 [Coleophoma crateriformis]
MPTRKATASKATPATTKSSAKAQPAKESAKAAPKANTASKRKADSEIDEPKSKKTKSTEVAAPAKAIKKATAPKAAAKKAAPAKAASKPTAKADKPAAAKKEKTTKEDAPAPKKAAPKAAVKKAPAKKEAARTATPDDADDEDEIELEVDSAPKVAKVPKVAKPAAAKKALPVINTPPTQKLDIYVFGEGTSGELGLGSVRYDGKMPIDVKRPRINELLSAKTVGIVQIAVGGMHCAALTHDNKILTWGVNDQGALGRDTKWDGGLKDIDAKEDSESEDDDDTGMNPKESTPAAIDTSEIPEGTVFTQLVASDSATFALTAEGLVYGWGTFRGNDGILGFRAGIHQQRTPMLIPELKKITYLASGTNHILAVDNKGKCFGWGAGEQNQLARRVVSRTASGALIPREFGLQRKKITYVACGNYHSFAMDNKGHVYAWGLNTFGQTGVPKPDDDEDDNSIPVPTLVESLEEYDIKEMDGGSHHTIACTETGEVLIWGRIDNAQGGMDVDDFPKDKLYFDENEKPRYLIKPHTLPDLKASTVSAGTDHCIIITTDGKAYSWGFSGNYQTGQGTIDDIEEATEIANTALKGKKLVFAGPGGQFSVLAGIPEQLTNGV